MGAAPTTSTAGRSPQIRSPGESAPAPATRCGKRHDSEAHADACHPPDSCDRRQGLTRAAQPGTDRSCGRPARDCTHPGQPHRHGQRVAYVRDRCRCTACTAANTAASRIAVRRQALGRPGPLVEARAVRVHLERLRRGRIGYGRIARLSGTSATHVREIAGAVARSGNRPPIRRIRPDLARRLLAIEPVPANRAPRCQVDGTGARRRLQALVAVGWPLGVLADRLGRTPVDLRRAMTCSAIITEGTARRVRDLYEQLWDTQPPRATARQREAAELARAQAANRGWPPPLAWDDIDTDLHPHCDPAPQSRQANLHLDEIAIARAVAGDGIRLDDLTPVEQTEAVHRLTERGTSIRDIAAQLQAAKRTVSRRRGSAASAA